MTQAIVAGAVAVAALNALPGVIGAWLWYFGLPSARGARTFWLLMRVGQGSALTLALAVGSLAAAGNFSRDRLFYLYALLPLAVGFIAEQLRVASAQTVLDQRGLAGAAAVGELPEDSQRELVSQIVRREIGVMAASEPPAIMMSASPRRMIS